MRWLPLSLLAACTLTWGQQPACDCTQLIGPCEASINLRPAGGQEAVLRITSTAPACSKVSYLVEGTPHFTILRGAQDEDTVTGSRLTRDSVSRVECQICKQIPVAAPAATSAPVPAPAIEVKELPTVR